MLTGNPLTEVPGQASSAVGPGERLRRLRRRRQLIREEIVAVLVLLLFLAVTVAVLATQWLGNAPSANGAGLPHPSGIDVPYGGTT